MNRFFNTLFILIVNFSFLSCNSKINSIELKNRPYHHLNDGTFRNPFGSPKKDENGSFSYITFNLENRKLDLTIPKNHTIDSNDVLSSIDESKNSDYILWIGHATFLIKLGNTTIITDPFFSNNAGPFIFGPKRYVKPAINLNQLPKVDLFLLTHNHYDHLDYSSIKNFPYKRAKVITPLRLTDYFLSNDFRDVNELDWYESMKINDDLKITLLPAIHWSKRTLFDTNKSLWGSFLIEYKDKKFFFACDTGYGNIYKKLGNKYGPIDISFINIGAYDFRPMYNKSIYHSTPKEALQIGKDLNSKKVIGMHWGTIVLSLEPILDPPVIFKNSVLDYDYKKDDAIIFKIGELKTIDNILR